MPPPQHDLMNQIYKMTKENNEMLHSMRRRAFLGGLLKFALYALFLIGPIWFYYTYLNDSVQNMLKAFNQMQTTGANVQASFGNFQESLKQLQEKIPGMSGTTQK